MDQDATGDEMDSADTKSATEDVPGPMRETIKLDETGHIQHVEFVVDRSHDPVVKLERLEGEYAMGKSPSSTSSYGSSLMETEEVR